MHSVLVSALWPQRNDSLVFKLTAVIAGSLLLALSSKLQVPFWPVPMTMQTLVVLTIGMALGPRLALATLGLYLLQGAVGLPVFAGTPEKGLGLAYMTGPTGGYLAGFVIAAVLVGKLAERRWDRHPLTTAAAMLAGMAVIYALGAAWLAGFIGIEKAVQFGVLPFLLADAVKIMLATALIPLAWRAVRRFSGGGHA
ncbi:biotin transporter BioY [Pelagibius litoralis]|uniref:Biotin transporter n=1 Tax=Pelagibius litoralis TaxID=374515 RepID=A0A967F075_9PROT|nr:biotin transporter BioY [Pelagibius litoralis]NIA70611.1 biotin transporter BioY [Pelagibius litoralis]